MFTAKYNSYTKEHIIYKEDKQCAIIRDGNLTFSPNLSSNTTFSIEEISDMLDSAGY